MYIFVYGTLMQRGENHQIIKNKAKFISTGYIKGELYDLGVGFPAAVKGNDPQAEIYGEIYEVNNQILKDIDELEGYYPDRLNDSLYIREETEAHTFKKQTYTVQVYFLNPEKRKLFLHPERLEGGRWI